MTSEEDRAIEQLLRDFNTSVTSDMRVLRDMQREFNNLASRSGNDDLQSRRFADAIAALAGRLEQTMGVTLELANAVFAERMRRIRERRT